LQYLRKGTEGRYIRFDLCVAAFGYKQPHLTHARLIAAQAHPYHANGMPARAQRGWWYQTAVYVDTARKHQTGNSPQTVGFETSFQMPLKFSWSTCSLAMETVVGVRCRFTSHPLCLISLTKSNNGITKAALKTASKYKSKPSEIVHALRGSVLCKYK
jgi:hypothetical protein